MSADDAKVLYCEEKACFQVIGEMLALRKRPVCMKCDSSKKCVGIIQSNYIPWRGYFDFMDDVDLFIYLDDVQYTIRDWRNRNKIKTRDGLIWVTVPVIFSRNNIENIEGVKIDYSQKWVEKHINSIRHAYSKSPYFKQYAEAFFDILNKRFETISELNVTINNWVMQHLAIKTRISMSSDFSPVGSKTDRLIDILKKTGATSYLSGPSAKGYIEVEKFKEAGIGLEYKVYEYPDYPQLHGSFEPHVSVLDLLFNCGPDSKKYLKSLKPNEVVVR